MAYLVLKLRLLILYYAIYSKTCAQDYIFINLIIFRGAKICIPWFDRPCTYYDAILPLRVLLLKKHNPKVYR
jgi:hypothetical protein